MLCQFLVHKRVVRVEQRQDRSIVLEEIGEKQDRLLFHRPPQGRERWKDRLTLLVVLGKTVNVEPLRAEFRGQPPGLRVAEHPPRLHKERFGVCQLSGRGCPQKLSVGQRRPEKVAQPASQFVA